MTLALKTDVSGYKKGEIRKAVSYALTSATAQARQRFEFYADLCAGFEKKFQMSTDEFIQKFDAGNVGDDQDYFDWYAARRGMEIWKSRFEILSGVSV
jgi:hypothetical protein